MSNFDYLWFKKNKTHRCNKSLNNKMSIRNLSLRDWSVKDVIAYSPPQWVIGGLQYNDETMTPSWEVIYHNIEFCPYCGENLV